MTDAAKSVVLIYVSRDGVEEVQVHAANPAAEREGDALYKRLRPLIDRIDRKARAFDEKGER